MNMARHQLLNNINKLNLNLIFLESISEIEERSIQDIFENFKQKMFAIVLKSIFNQCVYQ